MATALNREPQASRKHTLYQFTQDTTFHGLRFITEKAPVIRRLVWTLLVLGCVTIFVGLILTRLLYLMDYPKAVDLKVIYADELHLPAMTVCNQNYFRKSKTFEMGVFDRVENRFHVRKFDRNINKEGCQDKFETLKGQFFVDNPSKTDILNIESDYYVIATYAKTSGRVCQDMCLKQHDAVCNSVVYNHTSNTCFISRFSNVLNVLSRVNIKTVDTFMRRRCNGKTVTKCTFEDSSCPLYEDPEAQGGRWRRHSGPTSTPETGPRKDHTTGAGHYMYVDSSDAMSKLWPTLSTPFLEATEPLCLEFALSIQGRQSDVGEISVFKVSMSGYQNKVWSTKTLTRKEWELQFFNLGTGVFQINFAVESSDRPEGDIAIDDVTFGPCDQLVQDCRKDQLGKSYTGNISTSASGNECLPWYEDRHSRVPAGLTFPDGGDGYPASFCRNPDNDENGPWCYVGNYTKEYCNISYCECTEKHFQCGDGMCINRLAACDGYPDCWDETDETHGCDFSVDCNFEQVSKCGYQNVSVSDQGEMTTWIRYSGQMRNGHLKHDHTTYSTSTTGHYLYLDSGSVTLTYRKRVAIKSPPVPMNESSNGHCLSLYTYTGRDALFPEAVGSIKIFQQFGKYDKKPVMEIFGSERHSWIQRQVNLPSTTRQTQILIQAIFGRSYYSDMALDDIMVTPGECNMQKEDCNGFTCRNGTCIATSLTCDGEVDCADFADEDWDVCSQDLSLSCTFSGNFKCGYRDESDPDLNGWKWSQAEKAVFTSDELVGKNPVKRLISPKLELQEDKCLHISYNLDVVSAYCALYIHQEEENIRYLLHVNGYNGDLAGIRKSAYVTLPKSERMSISVELNCSSEASTIRSQIDQIELSSGTCEEAFSGKPLLCDFTAGDPCGYLDLSKQGANWVVYQNGQGMVASNWDSRSKNKFDAVLISPALLIEDGPECLSVNLGREGLPNLQISDTLKNNTIVWKKNKWRNTISAHFFLGTGEHRLNIVASLSFGEKVFLTNISIGNHMECEAQKCGDDFRCDTGKCIPRSLVCDFQNDCPSGEDEASCVDWDSARGRAFIDPDSGIVNEMDLIELKEYTVATLKDTSDDLTNFYHEAGHQSSDMIYRCSWAGTTCSPLNFTTEITDYGLCHTMNSHRDGNDPLRTANTGSSSGLKLVLNVEQYEYMHGPQTDAGIKMFLYDQSEIPLVRDLGFAVSPGLHALIAVKLSQTKSLSSPWGRCERGELRYGGNYTYSACVREQETLAMLNVCRCRDAYMPGNNASDPEVCDLQSYLDCVSHQENFRPPSVEECTEPCVRKVYETQMSYAALSSLSVSQILTSDTSDLKRTLLNALRIRQRTTSKHFVQDISQMTQIATRYKTFLRFIKHSAWSADSSILVKGSKALRYFLHDIVRRDLNKALLDTAEHQLEVFENTYGPIKKTIKHHWHVLQMQMDVGMRSFDRYINKSIDRDDAISKLKEAYKGLKTLKDAVYVYFQSLSKGKSVFESSSLRLSQEELEYLPSVAVLGNNSLCPQGDVHLQTPILNALLALLDRIKNHTINNDATGDALMLLKNLSLSFAELKREFHNVEICIDEYANFLHSVKEWDVHVDALLEKEVSSLAITEKYATVDDVLDFVDETKPLKDFGDIVQSVMKSVMAMTEPIKDIMDLFSVDSISHAVQTLDKFVSRVQLRLIEPLRNKISSLKEQITSIYVNLLKKDLEFSRYMGSRYNSSKLHDMLIWRRPQIRTNDPLRPKFANDVFRPQASDVFVNRIAPKAIGELVGWYLRPLQEAVNALDSDIRTHQSHIEDLLMEVMQRFDILRSETVVGEEFIRRNFLVVDLFFAQLKYEEITQIKAYDIGAFFSDVGGFMGLLLGGSVITLFEFFDLIVYQLMGSHACQSSRKKKEKEERPFNSTHAGQDEGTQI